MDEIELKNKNINSLLKLINENPKLRIVPLVDSEVVADDGYSFWVARWGSAEVDEIYSGDERLYVRSHDEEELEELAFERVALQNPAWSDSYINEQLKEEINGYDWEKVILVNITLP